MVIVLADDDGGGYDGNEGSEILGNTNRLAKEDTPSLTSPTHT